MISADVVVVGSGAGGSVVAATLAAAGRDVLIIEEGGHVKSSSFTQRDGDMYRKLFRNQGMQASEDGSVVVLQGSCVGGSTVINQADVTPIPEALFSHWRDQFGLSGITFADFEAAANVIKARIGAGPIAEHEINANNRRLVEAARTAGYSAGYFDDNRVGCVGSGYCHLGCAYDAKKSALVTFVPDATAAGARLLAQHRVRQVVHKGGHVEQIVVEETDERGSVVAEKQVRCKHLIIAAGSIHTPLLLRRSRLGGRLVGRNLTLQPQGGVLARFPDRIRSFRGIPQSGYVDEFEEITPESGFGGFRIEGIFGPPATATGFLPGFGAGVAGMLARYDQLAGCLVLVPDRPRGKVAPYGKTASPRIVYSPSDDVLERLRQGMVTAAKLYLAAGAEVAWFATATNRPMRTPAEVEEVADRTPWRAVSLKLISAHPQGTARMSDSKRLGVVDSTFAVKGVKGVYVADGSVFPTTASSHTMLPIMSFARIAAERLLAATAAS